mmetsp:Transcript_16185/g.33395  ORF Transcript_16185/g.33395 Transcript_16185/m.33395 type:complete len:175 (-) Transcript_16185:81-605(-)
MIAKSIVFLLALIITIITIISIHATDDEGEQHQIRVGRKSQNINSQQLLNMTLFVDKCAGGNFKSYVTPINTCYSSSKLFPNDPSWSGKDVRDDIICQTLVRTIFDTENSTCLGAGDNFEIPLNECVGPFGKPRPWGTFRLIQGENDKYGNIASASGLSSICEMNVPGRMASKD